MKVVEILDDTEVETIERDIYYAMHLTGYANVVELSNKLRNAYKTKQSKGKGWKLYITGGTSDAERNLL